MAGWAVRFVEFFIHGVSRGGIFLGKLSGGIRCYNVRYEYRGQDLVASDFSSDDVLDRNNLVTIISPGIFPSCEDMTMVYETRKVVEDYVLYKIKHHFTENDGDEVVATNELQERFSVNGRGLFPLPQDPPSEINSAVRNVASDFEKRYKAKYPSLLEGLRANHTASSDIDDVFSRITRDLFQIPPNKNKGKRPPTSSPSGGRKAMTSSPALVESDSVASGANKYGPEYNHINWGHVVGLLVFTGILSVRCVEINNNERVDEIVNWVSEYLDSELGVWLQHHGGWNGFARWYKESRGSPVSSWFDQYPGQDIKTVLKVSGAVAAFALGFVMLSRK